MPQRVFIIHGWNGDPANAWFPWLRTQFMTNGMDVQIPAMPWPRMPSIEGWVNHMHRVIGRCDTDTYFIGHSLGAQAVLRYLATLPQNEQAGGVVCVGGFQTLGGSFVRSIAAHVAMNSWLRTPLPWDDIRTKAKVFTAFFSTEDTWVMPENIVHFEKDLGAHISMLSGYGHFTTYDRVRALPEVLNEVLRMADRPLPNPAILALPMPEPVQASRIRMAWDVVQRTAV